MSSTSAHFAMQGTHGTVAHSLMQVVPVSEEHVIRSFGFRFDLYDLNTAPLLVSRYLFLVTIVALAIALSILSLVPLLPIHSATISDMTGANTTCWVARDSNFSLASSTFMQRNVGLLQYVYASLSSDCHVTRQVCQGCAESQILQVAAKISNKFVNKSHELFDAVIAASSMIVNKGLADSLEPVYAGKDLKIDNNEKKETAQFVHQFPDLLRGLLQHTGAKTSTDTVKAISSSLDSHVVRGCEVVVC